MIVTSEIDIKKIIEAAIMAAERPLTVEHLSKLFEEDNVPSNDVIKECLQQLMQDYQDRGVELKEVASGFRFQVNQTFSPWVQKLWQEKPAKYSRALLETLALIVYRQPITRAEIEEIRGVAVSTTIIKTLLEREWVRVLGYKEVPGKPALYATTKQFLDDFNLKTLSDLPPLSEIQDMEEMEAKIELQLQLPVSHQTSNIDVDITEEQIEVELEEQIDE